MIGSLARLEAQFQLTKVQGILAHTFFDPANEKQCSSVVTVHAMSERTKHLKTRQRRCVFLAVTFLTTIKAEVIGLRTVLVRGFRKTAEDSNLGEVLDLLATGPNRNALAFLLCSVSSHFTLWTVRLTTPRLRRFWIRAQKCIHLVAEYPLVRFLTIL